MEITDKIKQLKFEQLEVIIKARRAVDLSLFLSVNGKARSACIQRHHGWQDELLKFTNASIEASIRAKLGSPISTAAIISAFESMGLGILAKTDLTLEEYDLIISPVVSSFPELIAEKQDWTPIPLEQGSKYRPYIQYQLPPEESRTQATLPKKTRPFRRTEDNLEAQVEEAAFNSADFIAALKPKEEVKKVLSKDDAIAAMLAAMKPKSTDLNESGVPNYIADDIKEHWPEAVVVPVEQITSNKFTSEELLKMMQPKKE